MGLSCCATSLVVRVILADTVRKGSAKNMQIETTEPLRQMTEPRLPPTVIFSLLRSPHRCYVLSYLSRRDRAVAVDELAEGICRRDGDTSPEYQARVARGLAYVHLPKLAHAGAIDYRPGRGTVELATGAEPLVEQLRLAADQ